MSMDFDGMKKVETDEEDEGVSEYLWEEDDKYAGVHEIAQDCFSLMGEEVQSRIEHECADAQISGSTNMRENSTSLSLVTDMGPETW